MKKRMILLIGTLAATFVLAGCGSNPKEEYISFIEEQAKIKKGTYDFKFSIKQFELADSGQVANPLTSMLMTQLKSASVSGVMKTNIEDKDQPFSMDMTLKGFGMEIPFKTVGKMGKEPKIYLAMDMMEYLYNVVEAMGGAEEDTDIDFSQLKGKYVDVFELAEESPAELSLDYMKELEASQKEQEKIQKKRNEYLKGLDKSTFVKKGNTISHTFTKKELADLIAITTDEDEDDVDFKTLIESMMKEFSIEMSVDTKTNKMMLIFTMKPQKEQVESAGFNSISIAFETALKEKKADIVMPKKEAILTLEEFESYFPNSSALEEKLSEEEFKEVKQTLEENKESIDAETQKIYLENLKPFVTEEQFKELEAIFK